ncbi:hypothetical protein PV341_37705 [Streptomyces sp. PA03-1a]|nr:hypothetical protein [Streptomyces sp. PA03-1a]
MQRRVIVMPPSTGGGRRVRVDGEILGIAYHLRGFQEFLRRAGLDPDAIDLADPDLVEWRGAGPGVWT